MHKVGPLRKVATELGTTIDEVEEIFVRLNYNTSLLEELAKAIKEGTDKKGECTYCDKTVKKTDDDYILCLKVKTLKNSPGANVSAGVQKLCTSIRNKNQLENVVSRILLLTMPERNDFLGDVKDPCTGSAYLCGNVSALTAELIEAWKVVRTARCSTPEGNCNSKMPVDFSLLQAIVNINTTNLGRLDGDAGLTQLIKANKRSQCNTCGTEGKAFLGKMNDYVKNLDKFAKHHGAGNFVEAKNYLKNDGNSVQAQSKREGQIFIVRALAENETEFANISAFEFNSPGCEPDVVTGTGTNAVYHEFKSWSDQSSADDADEDEENSGNAGIGAFYFFKNGYTSQGNENNSYKQFKGYLRNISSMNQMKYYFDAKKISGSQANKELFVKEIFQFLMQRTTIATNQTKSPQTEIFDAIWANVGTSGNNGLRQSLFGTRNKGDAEDYFIKSIVSNTSNIFYDFINVK